ncbi:asparagine synthase-related protein [Nannocystis bainbridge]|uniref:asparagine synthase (glutamine-hydrolyzing) n=1 Tax=Nannocystis bainbridge TaxID=2995303 RepID=A0ABT5DU14_9BACT|nr:asparagine synthase-related protein [Nannocystis bainbridge]MDC0716608.1 asparagine synthase-related protein [Nannocystis bainbridge]
MTAHCYEWRGRRGASLVGLVGGAAVSLDAHGVRAAFGEVTADGSTCIAGARLVLPPWLRGVHHRGPPGSLHSLLAGALDALPAGRVALALSGGVDSAALAGLLGARATVYTLAPELPGYSEEAEARAVAGALGLPLRVIRVTAADYVEALPQVIAACEAPLYNLHPVSRWLLARAVRADGHDVLVTGDGADEVFRGTSGADYLPIVGALARAAGLEPGAPFLAEAVARHVAEDPHKHALRRLAVELGVPEAIARRPKQPRFAPPIDLSPLWDGPRVAALAQALGREPDLSSDRGRVGWTTLALLSRRFPGLIVSCAA